MGLVNGDIPVWVISLPRSAERRASIAAQFEPLGIPVNWFDAVDGQRLAPDEIDALNAPRRKRYRGDLTRGELGCFLSHRALYERIAQGPHAAALVLEDDAYLAQGFVALVEALAASGRFDLISLDGKPKGKRYVVERHLPDGYTLVRPFESKSATQGYLVSRRGAQKLARYCRRIVHPIDVTIKRYWDYGGDIFNIVPAICDGMPGNRSTITERTKNVAMTPLGNFHHGLAEIAKASSFGASYLARALGAR